MFFKVSHYCRERQIWLADLKGAVGSEQRGIRPVLILKVYSKEMLLVVPLTSKNKGGIWYKRIRFGNRVKQRESFIIMSHVRAIHRSRLFRFVGTINKEQFNALHEATLKLMY